jgi:hypothetical protein
MGILDDDFVGFTEEGQWQLCAQATRQSLCDAHDVIEEQKERITRLTVEVEAWRSGRLERLRLGQINRVDTFEIRGGTQSNYWPIGDLDAAVNALMEEA